MNKLIKMRLFIAFSLIIISTSCLNSNNINNWIGDYQYDEKPTKAIAGYSMVMSWIIKIKKDKDDYIAIIEINGQQTYMIIEAYIKGDNNKINFFYYKGIDRSGFDDLKTNDHLFELRLINNQIITTWDKLTPRLLIDYKNEGICFIKNK